MVVYWTARFCIDLQHIYEKAIMRITRYLRYTTKFRIFYKVDFTKDFEVHIDTNISEL